MKRGKNGESSGRKYVPSSILTTPETAAFQSVEKRPRHPVESKRNLENWFKALLKCREKRKMEINITASLSYVLYSVVTRSVDKAGQLVDVSDGSVLIGILNCLSSEPIEIVQPCTTQIDKIKNLNRFLAGCRKLGLRKTELLDIENFLQNRNIEKTLQHLYSLYQRILTLFPELKLPQCPFPTQDLIAGEESIQILERLLDGVKHGMKKEEGGSKPFNWLQTDSMQTGLGSSQDGYMNNLMTTIKEYKAVSEKLIYFEAQINIEKDIISSYQDILDLIKLDINSFFEGKSPQKIQKKFQLSSDELERLSNYIDRVRNQYTKWRKIPLNVAGKSYNEVIIMNEDLFDEYSQYFTQYKSGRYSGAADKKNWLSTTNKEFGLKDTGIQCKIALEESIDQEVQVMEVEMEEISEIEESPFSSRLSSPEKSIKEEENENSQRVQEYKIEDMLSIIEGLSEERDHLLKQNKEQQRQLAEYKKYLQYTSKFEKQVLEYSHIIQQLQTELRASSEESSRLRERLERELQKRNRLEKTLSIKDASAKQIIDKEETYRAQVIELQMQLNRSRDIEKEQTNEISRAFEKFQIITMNSQKREADNRLMIEQLMESNKRLKERLAELEVSPSNESHNVSESILSKDFN